MFKYARNLVRTNDRLRASSGRLGTCNPYWCPGVDTARWMSGTIREADTIFLKGLTFHGYHGVLPEVRAMGYTLSRVNVTCTPPSSIQTLLDK
eukprot:9015680-Pyramimonas_sp.AAC.2